MAPALPYTLTIVLGMGFAFLERPWILVPAIILLFWIEGKRSLLLLPLLIGATLFAAIHLPPEKGASRGYFRPKLMKVGRSPFGIYTLAMGTLTTAEGNFPCSIYLPYRGKRATMDRDYIVEGEHKIRDRFQSSFKVKKWEAIPRTFHLTEWRFSAKKAVRAYLEKRIQEKEAFQLIAALATGDLMERSLAFDFGRLGLLHLLAISGFHFSLVALFVGWIASRLLPEKLAGVALAVLLLLFYLYMGGTASVMRAGITILFPLIGRFFGLKMPALNALAIAAIFALVLDPLALTNLGFQLSYLATFGILTLYAPLRDFLAKFMLIRTREEAQNLSFLDKHGYLLLTFFRSTIALTLAVNLTTLPLVLFVFGKFPLLSLFYNFFFPIGMALLLFLLLGSFLLPYLFPVTEAVAKFLLLFTGFPPKKLDFVLHTPFLNLEIVLILLTFLLFLGKIEASGDRSSVG